VKAGATANHDAKGDAQNHGFKWLDLSWPASPAKLFE